MRLVDSEGALEKERSSTATLRSELNEVKGKFTEGELYISRLHDELKHAKDEIGELSKATERAKARSATRAKDLQKAQEMAAAKEAALSSAAAVAALLAPAPTLPATPARDEPAKPVVIPERLRQFAEALNAKHVAKARAAENAPVGPSLEEQLARRSVSDPPSSSASSSASHAATCRYRAEVIEVRSELAELNAKKEEKWEQYMKHTDLCHNYIRESFQRNQETQAKLHKEFDKSIAHVRTQLADAVKDGNELMVLAVRIEFALRQQIRQLQYQLADVTAEAKIEIKKAKQAMLNGEGGSTQLVLQDSKVEEAISAQVLADIEHELLDHLKARLESLGSARARLAGSAATNLDISEIEDPWDSQSLETSPTGGHHRKFPVLQAAWTAVVMITVYTSRQ
jgi:hypothetical protein